MVVESVLKTRYRFNIAKVGIKHQSINHESVSIDLINLVTFCKRSDIHISW